MNLYLTAIDRRLVEDEALCYARFADDLVLGFTSKDSIPTVPKA